MTTSNPTSSSQTIDSNHITVTMDGTPIECEQYSTYLGITLDENLSWEYHCNNVANKMARNAGILNRIKNHLSTSSLCTLYNSLIFPYFSYGLEAWGTCHQKFLKPIITIQKKSGKINLKVSLTVTNRTANEKI